MSPQQTASGAVAETEQQTLGEGDTYLVRDLLPDDVATDLLEQMKHEVQWQTMHHHGKHESPTELLL
jgi:hypothetical protein